MDQFDDIWRSRFTDEDIPIGDWNTPDDERVWAGIAPHIPQGKKKKEGFFWWVFSLVLIGLASLMFVLSGAINTSQSSEEITDASIASKENTAKLTQEKSEAKIVSINNGKSKINNEKTKSIEPPKLNSAKATNRVKYKNNVSSLNKSTEENLNVEPPFLIKNRTEDHLKTVLNKLAQATEKSNTVSPIEKNKTSKSITYLPKRDLNPLFINTIDLKLLNIEHSIDKNQRPIIGWGVQVGAVLWQQKISSNYLNALSAFDFNYENGWGWSVAATGNVRINDYIQPYFGLQYEAITVQSGHNSSVDYELEREQQQGSMEVYQGVATPYGSSQVIYRLDRNVTEVTENTPLTIDISSNHEIRNWGAPIGVQFFPLGQKSRWQWMTNVGFGFNYLENINSSLSKINTNHHAISYNDSVTQQYDDFDMESWHFDFRLGTGIGFRWGNRSNINLNYQWARGINPVFQQGDYETYINRHHLTLGWVSRF